MKLLAKLFLGRGVDKKFPVLVDLFKKVYFLVATAEPIQVNIPLGMRIWVSGKDAGLGLFLRMQGRFEPIQTGMFLKTVKKGDVVIDIGANIGYYSVLASKLVGKSGKVFAFEPDPQSIKLLERNIRLNNCQNVEVVASAVDSISGMATIIQDFANPGESRLAPAKGKGGRSVKVITLDTFLKQAGVQRVNVIKIDVEGIEAQVLSGAEEILKREKNVQLFIECNPKTLMGFGSTAKTLVSQIKSLGFELKTIINEFESKKYEFTADKLNENLKRVSFVSLYAQK